MKFCGPKLSLCGIIISIWGIIQLVSFCKLIVFWSAITDVYIIYNTVTTVFSQVLMGFFYYIRSVALIEDLNISEEHKFTDPQDFYSTADKMYSLVRSYNDTYIIMLASNDLVLRKIHDYSNNIPITLVKNRRLYAYNRLHNKFR